MARVMVKNVGRYVSGEGNLDDKRLAQYRPTVRDYTTNVFHASKEMTFTEQDKFKALTIVNIFETSRPLGDYASVAVLNDGAGVSFGSLQFTHRSGALCDVVEHYLAGGGQIGRAIFEEAMPLLRSTRSFAREKLASDPRFKKALAAAAVTREMREAQHFVAEAKFLRPAIETCGLMGFTMPLSLAVVYDSSVHGSWDRIAARVTPVGMIGEKAWITEYVRRRHIWLTAIKRLKATNYRTRFFLSQIAIGNWELKLPLTVHGVRLASVLSGPPAAPTTPASGHPSSGRRGAGGSPLGEPRAAPDPEAPLLTRRSTGRVLPGENEGWPEAGVVLPARVPAGEVLTAAAAHFDRVDNIVTGLATRTDRAKSLWTTVVGTLTQAVWATFGFLVGLPRVVWIVVSVITGLLMLLYLYRQIVLGRIRETRKPVMSTDFSRL